MQNLPLWSKNLYDVIQMAFDFGKPPKVKKSKHTVQSAVEAHNKSRRDLDATLDRTGQFELAEIKRKIQEKEEANKDVG